MDFHLRVWISNIHEIIKG